MRGETSAIRFSEAQKLLDYGFSNFEYIECSKKDDFIKSINVDKGTSSTVNLVFENDSGCLIKKGESNKITTNISIPNSISAPVIKNQKIGEVTYSIDGNIIAKVNVIANEDIKRLNYINMSSKVIKNWFTLFR